MNARQYAQAQSRPVTRLQKLIRAVLYALGVPITAGQVNETAIRLYRPVLSARDVNYAAALTYLAAQRLPAGVVVPAPRDYPLQALTSTIEKVANGLRIEGEPVDAATRADTRVIETARKAIEGPVTRHALEPARETIAAIGEEQTGEAERYGWARVLVGAYSCGFCAMLASRGPVYTSRQAALGRGGSPLDLYHTAYVNDRGKVVGGNCDCIAVMVTKGKKWEGQASHRKLDELWQDSTAGLSTGDARNAFRRDWDKKVADGTSHEYLVASLQPRPAAA